MFFSSSFIPFGHYFPSEECWQVASGLYFLDAAPYSPISDFDNNSHANHQLSIFISSCFSDVETIFSTAEKHEERVGQFVPLKELSWIEQGRRDTDPDPAQVFSTFPSMTSGSGDRSFLQRACVAPGDYTCTCWVS